MIYSSKCCEENTCLFQDSLGSGLVLDLSAFSCRTLEFTQKDYQYLFTPCGDRDSCQSNQDTVTAMMVQSNPSKKFCARIANWDQFESQPSYDGNEWKLEYSNGEQCFDEPRLFTTVWRCSESENDVRVQEVTEPVPCHYVMIMYTKYACKHNTYSKQNCLYPPSSDQYGLSAGWILIIIFINIVLIYCFIGYVFNATVRNKKNGFGDIKGNIPNLQFWISFPKYVMIGCVVSYEFIKYKIGKYRNDHNQIDDASNIHDEF